VHFVRVLLLCNAAGVAAHAAAPAAAAAAAAPAAAPAAAAAAVAAATSAMNGAALKEAAGATHDDPVLSPSSFVRFLPGSTAFLSGSQSVRHSSDHGAERSEMASGFSMLGSALPSIEIMQKMRRSLSPEELQAAFARR